MLNILWSGIITGCLYAIGALGIVMIFKSSRVVNFAHGNLAGLAAFFVYGFTIAHWDLPWWMAVLVTACGAVVASLIIYAVIYPVMFKSQITATIATLGFALIAQGLILILFGSDIVRLDLPIPKWNMEVMGVFIRSYHVAVLLVTAVIIGTLYLVIDQTKIGIAFRAVSDNTTASRICGLSIPLVQALSWSVASLLGVIAGLLIVPTTFLSPTTVGSFMLLAFAAAVIGGLDSLPGSAVGGILVGVLINVFSFYVSPAFTNTFVLFLILASLWAFPGGILSRVGGSRA